MKPSCGIAPHNSFTGLMLKYIYEICGVPTSNGMSEIFLVAISQPIGARGVEPLIQPDCTPYQIGEQINGSLFGRKLFVMVLKVRVDNP